MAFFKQKINVSKTNVKSDVKVLGGGCAKCNALEANAKTALERLGSSEEIEHVTDMADIATMGVMSTPALVVDDKILFTGKVATVEEIVEAISKIRG